MIEAGTVLILGAGASQPYGFPLGGELRELIIKSLNSPQCEEYKLLVSCGFGAGHISDFANNLNDSVHETIDDFLADRPTYREIGNHSIAITLMHCESHGRLFPKRDWYPKLVRVLGLNNGNSLITAILTLNYDRSLEHYLYHTIQVSYEGENRLSAYKRLENCPIIHLHGILAEYRDRKYEVPANLTADKIKEIANHIRITADDDLDISNPYLTAKSICSQATQIIFLGFGYHERIMQRLGFDMAKSLSMRGTSYRLSNKRRVELAKKYQGKLELGSVSDTVLGYFENVMLPFTEI